MTRNLLVYDMFYTCSTTSIIHLDYNPSRDRLWLDGFIDYPRLSNYLPNAWTRGLAPPFYYDYLMPIIWLPVRGLDPTRHSVCLKGQLSCLHAGRYTITQQYPIQEAFQDFILGRCLLTIILGILFQNKGFVQILTQRTYLVIGSGHKDWFER
jgi:hypothetical protein